MDKYHINSSEKCGLYPLSEIPLKDQNTQIMMLKRFANEIALGQCRIGDALTTIFQMYESEGKRQSKVSKKMVETRLRRLVYKADIYGRAGIVPNKNGYRDWGKKVVKRKASTLEAQPEIQVPSVVQAREMGSVDEDSSHEPIQYSMEDAYHEPIHEPIQDSYHETKEDYSWISKKRKIDEQQRRTGMIYLTPPSSPVLYPAHPKHTDISALQSPVVPLDPLFYFE